MRGKLTLLGLSAMLAFCVSCQQSTGSKTSKADSLSAFMDTAQFSGTIDQKQAYLYELSNKNGVQAYFTNFGARLVGLWVPDNKGELSLIHI